MGMRNLILSALLLTTVFQPPNTHAQAANIALVLPQRREMQEPAVGPAALKNLEQEVLSGVSPALREQYLAFRRAVTEKRFFTSDLNLAGLPDLGGLAAADDLYATLSREPALEPLQGLLKRSYAAALQDDAQQVMNIWLKTDVRELESIGKSLPIRPIPRQLARAAELQGEQHYLYASLKARQYLFEGVNIGFRQQLSPGLVRRHLALYQMAAALEPQSPLPWFHMIYPYCVNLGAFDSAFYCAEKATLLDPGWVYPYALLANLLSAGGRWALAEKALDRAEAIAPHHPYVANVRVALYGHQGKYREALGLFLENMGRDSSDLYSWNYLGNIYRELQHHPALASLRELPAWKTILNQYIPDRKKD